MRAGCGLLTAKTLQDPLMLHLSCFGFGPSPRIWGTGRDVQMTERAQGYRELCTCGCWQDRQRGAGERFDIWESDG